ncbi:MAG: aminopeptidase [Desulfomonilaceae bacterium]
MPSTKKKEKTRELKDKLFRKSIPVWEKLSEQERKQVFGFTKEYRDFLNQCRTERLVVKHFVEQALKSGFRDMEEGKSQGPKLFRVMRGKALAIAVVGKRPITDGIRLVASHVDSPRLDLKPNPLYEDMGLALLKTQYYGGIKKYQWISRHLAICGTVVRKDGSVVDIEIGLKPDEPVFTIPDLLPHLARKQMDQKASEFISGESLNIIAGSVPYGADQTEDRVKLTVLDWLQRNYDITEEDFTTAEIQVIPAEPARDGGLDAGLIIGYGQDDRVCAYTSFRAVLDTAIPEHTAVVVFYDKEEIGSEGNTSAQSRFLEMFLVDLLESSELEASPTNIHKLFFNSKALSADVAAAIDPTYADVYEKRNDAKLGYGITLKKYTGRGGKGLASDANAEYAGWVRKLFNEHKIIWQAAVLGKVDEGGGGTVAKYLANMGMEIIDCGPALLGMHSPLEVSSKDDVWVCYEAFKAFLYS